MNSIRWYTRIYCPSNTYCANWITLYLHIVLISCTFSWLRILHNLILEHRILFQTSRSYGHLSYFWQSKQNMPIPFSYFSQCFLPFNHPILKYFDCLEQLSLLLDAVLISWVLLLLIKSGVMSDVTSSSASSGSSSSLLSLFSIWEYFTGGSSQIYNDIIAFSILERISNISFE